MPLIRVVAAVLIRDDRQVLAARRGPSQGSAGKWEFPGGKVRPGEDDRAALAREIDEELGVEIEVGALVAEARVEAPARTILLVAYRCRHTAGQLEPREHDALRWCRAPELGELDWTPADVDLLPAVRRLIA
jgi:8-oxo-dGTP diphosphatase